MYNYGVTSAGKALDVRDFVATFLLISCVLAISVILYNFNKLQVEDVVEYYDGEKKLQEKLSTDYLTQLHTRFSIYENIKQAMHDYYFSGKDVCVAMNKLLESDFAEMRRYFCIIRYDHSEIITQELSSICDVRIIWGGNRTIETIRKASLPPRAIELAFADRHSIAIINSDVYLEQNPDEVAKEFYTDTYYTDQNACSSPRLVVWLGNNKEKARNIFWSRMNELVESKYDMKPIQAVDKYTSMCTLAMGRKGVKLISDNNYVVRVEVDALDSSLMDYKNGGGYFFEYKADCLDEIVPVLTKQCQTISILGLEKQDVLDIVYKYGVRGVDRIVLLGQTMGLEFIWDGYKMIETMSRFVYTGDYR